MFIYKHKSGFPPSFSVKTGRKSFIFKCQTPQEKTAWLADLKPLVHNVSPSTPKVAPPIPERTFHENVSHAEVVPAASKSSVDYMRPRSRSVSDLANVIRQIDMHRPPAVFSPKPSVAQHPRNQGPSATSTIVSNATKPTASSRSPQIRSPPPSRYHRLNVRTII